MRTHKPWLRSTGPRSPEGKARASRNAWRHGCRSAAMKGLRDALRRQRRFIAALDLALRARERSLRLELKTLNIANGLLSSGRGAGCLGASEPLKPEHGQETDRDRRRVPHHRRPDDRPAVGTVSGLCAVHHHVPVAARRARRVEAGASAHPLRHGQPQAVRHLRAQEIGPGGRRRDGEIPPAWRRLHLRRHGPPGAGFRHPLPAGGRAGEFRQYRRRQPGGPALYRGPPDRRGRTDHGGAGGGCGRFSPDL